MAASRRVETVSARFFHSPHSASPFASAFSRSWAPLPLPRRRAFAAVAARAPGLMIRAAINGPEITQSFVDAEAPSRQQGVYIDLINALFVGLNQFIPFLPALFDPVGGAITGAGNFFITQIANDHTNPAWRPETSLSIKNAEGK